MKAMLSGLRVLDISDANAFSCGRYFASLGAEVVHVEPPCGDTSRHNLAPPDLTNNSDKAFWQSQNVGKKSLTINLKNDAGVNLCRQLMEESDFVIESFTPGFLKNLGLDYPSISKSNLKVIFISITPFGQKGPYSLYKGGELIASAMGGVLDTCGYANETPVLEALDACTFHANTVAAMGAMMAYRERGLSGKGQHIDCSIQEVAASRNTNNLIAYQFDQRKLARAGNCVRFGVATVRVIWELKDGYCFHSMMTGKFGAPANSALSQWMNEDGFENPMSEIDWQNYDRSALPADTRLIWEKAMGDFFKSKTKDDIRTEGYKRGIRATVANSPDDVLNDPHLNAREFFREVQENQNSIKYPGHFIKSNNTITTIPALISEAGDHNTDVLSNWLNLSPENIQHLQTAGAI